MKRTVYGTRYPTLAFLTSGSGRSRIGHPPHPYETICYDSALLAAGIQDFNVVPYTSVLPKGLEIRALEEVRDFFFHGAVLEVIMAGVGFTYGQSDLNLGYRRHGKSYNLSTPKPVVAAGSSVGYIESAVDAHGNDVGGFAVEYVGFYSRRIGQAKAEKKAVKQLRQSYKHELEIRGLKRNSEFKHTPTEYIEATKKKPYAYTLSAFGFLAFANAPVPPAR